MRERSHAWREERRGRFNAAAVRHPRRQESFERRVGRDDDSGPCPRSVDGDEVASTPSTRSHRSAPTVTATAWSPPAAASTATDQRGRRWHKALPPQRKPGNTLPRRAGTGVLSASASSPQSRPHCRRRQSRIESLKTAMISPPRCRRRRSSNDNGDEVEPSSKARKLLTHDARCEKEIEGAPPESGGGGKYSAGEQSLHRSSQASCLNLFSQETNAQ